MLSRLAQAKGLAASASQPFVDRLPLDASIVERSLIDDLAMVLPQSNVP